MTSLSHGALSWCTIGIYLYYMYLALILLTNEETSYHVPKATRIKSPFQKKMYKTSFLFHYFYLKRKKYKKNESYLLTLKQTYINTQ